MARYMMVVQSAAVEGRDDEYNAWYDREHRHEILAIPGVIACRRFEATPIAMGQPGARYIALYEIETDDPGQLMAEMAARSADGRITSSSLIDRPKSSLWIYSEREIAGD